MVTASVVRWAATSAVVAALSSAALRVAEACSIVANEQHMLDPAETGVDTVAPGVPSVGEVTIRRGHGGGCGAMSGGGSCDDLGNVRFAVSATDDRTTPLMMGYRVTVSRGRVPDGLVPPGDVRPFSGDLLFWWGDGATDDQDSLDFDLEVRAVDLAGNVSAEAAIVKVRQDTGGCSIGRGSTQAGDRAGVFVFALMAAWAVARRREQRSRSTQNGS